MIEGVGMVAPDVVGWTDHWVLRQPPDALLEHGSGGQPDRVPVALRLQQLVDLWEGEGRIGAEIPALQAAWPEEFEGATRASIPTR